MELSSCINFILYCTQNAVLNYFRERLSQYDVTPIQYSVLKCLSTEDGQTPTQLAQSLRLDASSVTGLLARLEKKDLVSRVYSKEDRRNVHVHLLPAGTALLGPIDETIEDANREISSGFTEEDYALFKSQLLKIEYNARSNLRDERK